jgi:tetratricopeptide (TPR) repeat protein
MLRFTEYGLFLLCVSTLLLSSCQETKTTQEQITRLEKAVAAGTTEAQTDSLIQLYFATVQEHPDEHAANLRYLMKAAELQYAKKDLTGAVQSAEKALHDHGAGQSLTPVIQWYTLLWHQYSKKDPLASTLAPDQVVQVNLALENNQAWLDSSLVSLDKQMGSPVVTNKAAARQFINVAETYAGLIRDKNPDKAIDLMLKAAGLAKTIEEPERALELYQEVVRNGNHHVKTPTALFMMAFVYENDLNNLSKAKSLYEQFLREYPKDPDFADDAAMALKMLGKSPEEIIKAAGN